MKSIGQSTVDYAITSAPLFPFISDFWIGDYDCCMSDVHLPVCLNLSIQQEVEKIQVADEKCERVEFKSGWKSEKKNDYQAGFSLNKIQQLSEKINNMNSSEIMQEHIDQLTTELTDIIVEPAKKAGLCKKTRKNVKKSRVNPRKPWFNESCETSRRKYFKSKNTIWKAKNPKEKEHCIKNMKEKGKEYKSFIAGVQKDYTKNLHKTLREAKPRNTREYWKILKNAQSLDKKEPKSLLWIHGTQLA